MPFQQSELSQFKRWPDQLPAALGASAAIPLRIPTKPAKHSNGKPATRSDAKPAGVPI
jgi:hypothetical protein